MKSLVIDDSKLIGLIMQETLEQYGSCDVAFNPVDGFNKYVKSVNNNIPYDVVYLDLIMPIYNGYQVLEMIRNYEKSRNAKNSIIVIVSGIYDEENKKKAIELGADAYFMKPFNITEFTKFFKEKGLL